MSRNIFNHHHSLRTVSLKKPQAESMSTAISTNRTANTIHESIVPLINICRKIEACSKAQLLAWMSAFYEMFEESIKNVLIKLLCSCHANIPSELLEAFVSASPTESELTSLDDSISKSDLNDNAEKAEVITKEQGSLSLLQIPNDCKTLNLSFTYLSEWDLKSVQRVCRCLCVGARDPNALHEINASWGDYRHARYS